MSEYGSPRMYDPCSTYGDVYKYFTEQIPSQSTVSVPSTTTSSSSLKIPPVPSMLVTGFGLRNWDSLQRALLDDEQRRQMLLAQHDRGEAYECESLPSSGTRRILSTLSPATFAMDASMLGSPSPSLQYLMALEQEPEEYVEPTIVSEEAKSVEGEFEEEIDPRFTLAMRNARKYLKEHRIFDFFRFLIAHMVSELSENPIDFLIELLDKCLLYRSGFGNPPLLFEKPHLEQLFYLMDRMRTGFIDMEQYESGMKTLGLCNYDKHPPLCTENKISQEFFVEEAYECLTDLFVEMIRRRGVCKSSIATPPPTAMPSVATVDDFA